MDRLFKGFLALAFLFSCGVLWAQQTVNVPYSGTATSNVTVSSGSVVVSVPYSGNLSLTIPTGCTLSGTVVTCPVTPPPPPPPPPVTGRTKITPSGSNDESALYAAAAKGPIEMGCTTTGSPCTFKTTPISWPANADVYIDDNVTVSDMAGYGNYDVMFQAAAANIKIAGSGSASAGLLTMPTAYAKNLASTNQGANQYNHAFQFYKASASSLTGLRFAQCGGDCIYIQFSSNVIVSGNVATNPIRNGLSATDQNTNVTISGNTFSGANNMNNAGIADGIDVEPNGSGQASPSAGEFVTGLTISNNQLANNAGNGLCLCLYFTNSSVPITVSVVGNQANGNKLTAFNQDSWPSKINGSITGSGNTVNGSPVTFPAATGSISKAQHKLN